jgi:DNA-binding CsgD family transcriptional regulator
VRWHAAELTGRVAERAKLDRFIEDVRAGESRVLVLRGEPGVGKTALLDYLAGRAQGCRVERAGGVQSELELAFAGLHQLCAPMLDRVSQLPVPQREALRVAFGINAGPPPDRFLAGLAVLSLLSQVAEEQPLICVLDDAQWLDHASAQILAFASRRLGAESLGLVFATRDRAGDLAGLPDLMVSGLPDADARSLLGTVLTGPLDTRIRDQIVAETGGNPLALLELPRGLTPAELAGGFGLPGAAPLATSLEENFRRRVDSLPEQTRRLLLLAAADPVGDAALMWRAATWLGINADAATPAADAGLAEFGTRVRFRHPLVRSGVYQSAPVRDRQEVHRALAEVTDPGLDPDRRAWHRAQGAAGPDAGIAAELERSAGRARARGGIAAAAAFLERAAALTLDPAQRAGRALVAAQAKLEAGAFESARDLLATAEAGQLGELEQARADLIRARLAYVTNRGSDAPALLLKAARRLEGIDVDLSRATYLDALMAAIFAAGLAGQGGGVPEIARAAAAAPRPSHPPRAPDLLLDGTAAGLHRGYAEGLPILRQALREFGDGMSVDEELRWLWLAAATAMRTWDYDSWTTLSERYVRLARQTGALSELPLALISRIFSLLFAGELAEAAWLVDEVQAVMDATGSSLAPYGALGLAALRGDEDQASALIDATRQEAVRHGEGNGIIFAEWASAVLRNGLGHYEQAAAASQRATAYSADVGPVCWSLVELVEAGARTGLTETAAKAFSRLREMTSASRTDWALGAQARSQALLTDGAESEALYRESIDCFARTRLRVDLGRAHLVYGEWLRRDRRPADARGQLRTALSMFEESGVSAFAERARRELGAAGGTVHKRTAVSRDEELTAQEAQIARLARDGLSNPEIGTRLFLSARTVQYHLRKVFTKLGISSRSQLASVLPAPARPPADHR